MADRLRALLDEQDCLYGLVCRDATAIDVELYAQLGYHFVWLDLEHCPQSLAEAVNQGRSIAHLGMVPLVRIPELSRTNVQLLLDGGIEVLTLSDVRTADEVRRFVQLGKYPPLGRRGVSSTTAGTGYSMGADPQESLAKLNEETHLMALIESDEGYAALDEILAIEGLDIISVGLQDWGASLGLFGEQAKKRLRPKVEHLMKAAEAAGKIVTASVVNSEEARYYRELGARVFILGVDITIKRNALAERIAEFHEGP